MRLRYAAILLFSFALFTAVLVADRSGLTGRAAWTLDTPRLHVTVLKGGGHVAEIVLKTPGAINPLWIQNRPTIEPSGFDPARDAERFGGGPSARLMSGLAGHSLCFPYWGNPSPSEERAGMTFHGETGIVNWTRENGGAGWLEVSAELPDSRTRFKRRITVHGNAVWFDETATNEAGWDRPVTWCEHVTLGSPFLERGVATFTAAAKKGKLLEDPPSSYQFWPRGKASDGGPIDLSEIRNAKTGDEVNNFLVDPAREIGYFAAYNPKFSLLFGYVFRRTEFPWLNVWESYSPEFLARGMELADTAVHGTARSLAAQPSIWGLPSWEWLNGKGSLHKRFAAFSVTVPKDFGRVKDVRVEGSELTVFPVSGMPLLLDLGEKL